MGWRKWLDRTWKDMSPERGILQHLKLPSCARWIWYLLSLCGRYCHILVVECFVPYLLVYLESFNTSGTGLEAKSHYWTTITAKGFFVYSSTRKERQSYLLSYNESTREISRSLQQAGRKTVGESGPAPLQSRPTIQSLLPSSPSPPYTYNAHQARSLPAAAHQP
jgi:hypothetical protein